MTRTDNFPVCGWETVRERNKLKNNKMQPGMGSEDRSVLIWSEENMCVLMLISGVTMEV